MKARLVFSLFAVLNMVAPQKIGFVHARVSNTTVSTWHEEMILLAHTSYLFAQCRTGTYPPFWALGCSPMQEHTDKLEFVSLIKRFSHICK
jgi:hypothetical protein